MLWRVSLVAGRRLAPSRRRAAIRWPGKSRAPISIRSGPPIATAISYRPAPLMSGSSSALQSFETSFHQDLNGDGAIGVPGTVIESAGSTSLVAVSNHFFLDSISTGSDPSLKYGGADVVAGQFGGWTPIGAEQTASGYQVAWKVSGADQYSVWTTDSNGNFISTSAVLSGSSSALKSFETSFHQDLNGDGAIGVPGMEFGRLDHGRHQHQRWSGPA